MRSIWWQKFLDEGRPKMAPPLAWAVAAAAIASVFAVVVMIVNFTPLNREDERRVETELPPGAYDTVSALIKATGNSCANVCSISALGSLSASTMLDVSCASPDSPNGCLTPTHYRINVETVSGPQR